VILALVPETVRDLSRTRNWFDVSYIDTVQPWTDDYSNLFEILRWK